MFRKLVLLILLGAAAPALAQAPLAPAARQTSQREAMEALAAMDAAKLTPTTLHEVGERVTADGTATKVLEMNLTRLGETDWPAAGRVPPR